MIYTFLVVSCKTMYCESKDKSAQQKENKNHMVAKGMKAFNNMISKGIEYAKQGGFRGKRRNSADLSTSKNNLTEDNDIPLFSDKKKKKMTKMNVLDNSDIKRRNSSKIKGELFFQLWLRLVTFNYSTQETEFLIRNFYLKIAYLKLIKNI